MCSCGERRTTPRSAVETPAGELVFRVDDMACGHCAGTIEKAVEKALPGTRVEADPASKLVTVRGTSDFAAIRSVVIASGYTPGREPVAADR